MKPMFTAIVLAALSQPAFAGEPHYLGKPDCRIVASERESVGIEVSWDGPCKDGYADGQGKLEVVSDQKTLLRYTGEVQRGLPNGKVTMARHSGEIVEGWFKDGRPEGKGVESSWRGTYEGEFKAGLPDGYGKMVYTLGGSYEGEFKAGKMHGKGTAVYSSGRLFTGEFIDGVAAGDPMPPARNHKSRLTSDKAPAGQSIGMPRTIVEKSLVPLTKRYDQLTPEEKAVVRSLYPLLDKDDEPPYFKEGGGELFRNFVDEIRKIGARGDLTIVLDIDSTGKATSAVVSQTPSRAVARAALKVLMQEEFKPASCAGKPCAMKFPFLFGFTAD